MSDQSIRNIIVIVFVVACLVIASWHRRRQAARLARMVWQPGVTIERMGSRRSGSGGYTVQIRLDFVLPEDKSVTAEVTIPGLTFLWDGSSETFHLARDQVSDLRSAPYNRGIGRSWTEGDVQKFLSAVENQIAASLKEHQESMAQFAEARARQLQPRIEIVNVPEVGK